MANKRLFLGTTAILALASSGCASMVPQRDIPASFHIVDAGLIEASQVAGFTDCMSAGFMSAHERLRFDGRRVQRQAEGFLVTSSAADGTPLDGVFILPSGRAELWESPQARHADTSGERDAFVECLAEFVPTWLIWSR